MWKTGVLAAEPAVKYAIEPTVSVLPALDALIARLAGRGIVAAAEIVDDLLDLRLVAEAIELVQHEVPGARS